MIEPKRRQQIYDRTFQFIKKNKVQYIPVDIDELCKSCGVGLVPLSRIVNDTGLSEKDIFAIWGNEDGSVSTYGNKHRIAYNDHRCAGRKRFTVCEELGHIICEHTKDPSFNMFCQTYEEDVYARYDEEARMSAGFLVCHPKFFFTHEWLLEPEVMSEVCGITPSCATTRYAVLQKYRSDIEANVAYRFLSLPRAVGGMRKYEMRRANSTR